MHTSAISTTDATHRKCPARFRYSAYWRSWSLLLTDQCNAKPGYGPIVEVDLTSPSADLDRLLRVNVRRHCTAPAAGDRFLNELPEPIANIVFEIFGAALAGWLLNPDTEILGKIDWARYAAHNNGGASLYQIAHDRFRDAMPRALPVIRTAA